jgi:carboxyl-terminal processing protease
MSKGLRIFLVCLGLIVLVFFSYSFGFGAGKVGDFFAPRFGYEIINKNKGKPVNLDFSLFWKVWDEVHQKYVGNIDDKKLMDGAIAGILEGLDDPYSMILNESESKGLTDELSGTFGGIGVEITVRDGNLMIVAPIKDSPADKAGVKAKDIILKIDDKGAKDLTFEQAVAAIRGEPGTKVRLTIMRQGLDSFKEFEITRSEIMSTSAAMEIKDNVAYIKLREFGMDTTNLLNKYASDIKNNNNIKGIVIDLRNNPGGYLETAVETTSLFIEDGVIVYEQDKNGDKKEYKAQGSAILGSYPLVVLVNEGSASASEIMAGALQDYKKGTIVGEKTFGKGSVQEFAEIGGGLSIKITVAKWLTPLGRAINGEGIKPDIEVGLTDEDIKADRDPQLDRAIQEVKNK